MESVSEIGTNNRLTRTLTQVPRTTQNTARSYDTKQLIQSYFKTENWSNRHDVI